MKDLEIKEKREKLGLTQEQLAKLLGVSKNTVFNYEKGKAIPASKVEILEKILNSENPNIVTEPAVHYKKTITDFNKKIKEVMEKIQERQQIIKLLAGNQAKIKHQEDMIELLYTQIEIIEEAKIDKENDL